MRPLTHRVWEQHYVQLRPHILEEWPDIDRMKLESIRDDWDGLIEVVQQATGMSADHIRAQLRKLDVDELGLGTGERTEGGAEGRASIAQLRLSEGFSAAERERITDRLAKLNRILKRFPADGTELILSVKDRETPAQKLTLECVVPHYASMVATSHQGNLRDALMEVREDLWRQINDAVSKRKEAIY